MELFQMRYIVEVARRGSFSRAAENLYISQAALSQQVRRVETALGTQLFIRSTRSLSMTDAGRTFVQHAEEVLRAAERLDATMQLYKSEQKIRIVSTPRMAAMRFLRAETVFSEKHAEIPFHFDTVEERDTALLAETPGWDIAILQQALLEPFRNNARFYKELLFSFAWCLLTGPDHPLAGRSSVRMEELQGETFFAGTEELAQIARKENILPPSTKLDRLSSSNYDIMSERVRSGKAVAVGIRPIADYYDLCAVPILPRKMDKTYLVCPAERKDSAPVRELLQIFRSLSY